MYNCYTQQKMAVPDLQKKIIHLIESLVENFFFKEFLECLKSIFEWLNAVTMIFPKSKSHDILEHFSNLV